MGSGASIAKDLTSPRLDTRTSTGLQYREMMEHLRTRFAEEVEILREKHGEVDQDALIVKLLVEEFSFTTVEVGDLSTLKQRPRDRRKVYLLGESNFMQPDPSACVDVCSLNSKALEMVGDEKLAAVARDTLPSNTRISKKAVDLMGTTKVITERKALQRLGSEMSDSMRALQIKTERKQQKEEMTRRCTVAVVSDGVVGGGERGKEDGGPAADSVEGELSMSPKNPTAAGTGSPLAK